MPSSNGDKILEVFFSYSHKDEALCDELNAHLAALKHQRAIKNWTDRRITAGDEWRDEIEKHLDSADLILLLVSADFLNSDFCYLIETSRALLRHESGDARVIPVIVRPVDWRDLPIGKIQALPKDGKPITSWPNRDEAWLNVAQGIRKAFEEMAVRKAQRIRESGLLPAAIPRPPHVGFVARRDQEASALLDEIATQLGRAEFRTAPTAEPKVKVTSTKPDLFTSRVSTSGGSSAPRTASPNRFTISDHSPKFRATSTKPAFFTSRASTSPGRLVTRAASPNRFTISDGLRKIKETRPRLRGSTAKL